MKKRILRAALAVVLILAIAGCVVYGPDSPDMISVPGEKGHYTYRYADIAPDNWSPLYWSSKQERSILSYTTSPLYDITLNDTGDGNAYRSELATAMPEDVTVEYAGNKTYGVPKKAEEGYAYRITIRQDALWQDGTPVTTADFAYSLQQYLSPAVKSIRKTDYYYGYASFANAAEYVQDGYVPAYDEENGYAKVEDENLLFSMTQVNGLFRTSSLEEYYSYYGQDKKASFMDNSGHNIYERLSELVQDAEYVPLTDEIKTLITALCSNFGAKEEEDYKKLCFYQDTENAVTWEQVGFVAEDEYTMTFILDKPATSYELAYGLADLLLIKQDVYETDPDAYGCSEGSYQSYGPYVITSYDKDKGMELSANTNWYGYGDEAYSGQYQTTDIQIFYGMSEEETASRFAEGNLDDWTLGSAVQGEYEDSAYIYELSHGATNMYVVDTDLNGLIEENSNGVNHAILAYRDFRHGISLAIDRYAYQDFMNPEGKVAYGLFGPSYVSEIANGERYRNITDANEILYSIYGKAEDVSQISYYNTESAAKHIQAAYEACLADGNIRDTDQVVITFYSAREGAAGFLQEALNAASAGTSLENRIVVQSVASRENADIYEGTVAGSEWNPYAMLRYYLDSEYRGDDGFCPQIQRCTIKIGDENISMTFAQWYYELTQGEYRASSADTRKTILAYLEKGLLMTYKNIPLFYESETHLHSQRIVLGAERYLNSVVEYGGIRFLTYTMDDAEWSKYCEKQRYQLEY